MNEIVKSFLIDNRQQRSLLIELNFVLFPVVFNRPANRSITYLTPNLQFYEYDRFIVSNDMVHVWQFLANVMQRKGTVYGGIIKLGQNWIKANNTRAVSVKIAQQRIRIISNHYLEDFKKNPNQFSRKHLTYLKTNSLKKALILNQIKQIKTLHHTDRIRLANELLSLLKTYFEKRLYLINNAYKELRLQFYNVGQINTTHLLLLMRESQMLIDNNRDFDNDLIDLSFTCQKTIFHSLDNQKNSASGKLVQRFYTINERINLAKHNLKTGIGTYEMVLEISRAKKLKNDYIRRYKDSLKECKIILKSWIKTLRTQYWRNLNSPFWLEKSKKLRIKIAIKKQKDQIQFAKKILKLNFFSVDLCKKAIEEIKELIDRFYSSVEDFFKHEKMLVKDDAMSLFYKDLTTIFAKKAYQSIFKRSLEASDLLQKIYEQHLDKLQKHLYHLAMLKQGLLNRIAVHDLFKKDHINKTIFNNCENLPFAEQNSQKSPALSKAIAIFDKHQVLYAIYFIKHFHNLFLTSKNILVFSVACTKIFMWKEILLTINQLDFKKRSKFVLPCPYFSFVSRYKLIINIINKRYHSAITDIELSVKGVVDFPKSRFIKTKVSLEWRKKIKQNFNKPIIAVKNNPILNIFKNDEVNFSNTTTNESTSSNLRYNPYQQYESSRDRYLKYLNDHVALLSSQKKWLKEKLTNLKKQSLVWRKLNLINFNTSIDKMRLLHSYFKKNAYELLKKVHIVNKVAKKNNMVIFKKAINDGEIWRIFATNNYVLKRCLWLTKLFQHWTHFKTKIQKRKCLKYFNEFQIALTLSQVNLNEFYLFTAIDNFSHADLLRMYLGLQFLLSPKLIIYDGLKLSSKHEINFVKGLLIGNQNRYGYAIIFLQSFDDSQVASWLLPQF